MKKNLDTQMKFMYRNIEIVITSHQSRLGSSGRVYFTAENDCGEPRQTSSGYETVSACLAAEQREIDMLLDPSDAIAKRTR